MCRDGRACANARAPRCEIFPPSSSRMRRRRTEGALTGPPHPGNILWLTMFHSRDGEENHAAKSCLAGDRRLRQRSRQPLGLGARCPGGDAHPLRMRHQPGSDRSQSALLRYVCLRRPETAARLQLLSGQAWQRVHGLGYRPLDECRRGGPEGESRGPVGAAQREARSDQICRRQPLSWRPHWSGRLLSEGNTADRQGRLGWG